eukprot:TRINITY_DN26026_c0_g1_i1.p1 TRINITY_DN26026_c0_g1~~TRINITY_DN26026_c0_g1_i1.p1  ORF type:complete len:546 (-),score=45.07 TRINITY_DN26026_c0_g1_i1:480-2117(-)
MKAATEPHGSLTVEWCDEVPEWLHSMAHCMEEAAFHCKPPPTFCSSNETVVLKVSISLALAEEKKRISGRSTFVPSRITRKFSSEGDLEETKDLVFVARRSPLVIPPTMVLKTRLGSSLRERGLLRWLVMLLGLGAICLGMVVHSLGTTHHRVPDPADGIMVDLRLRSLTFTLLELAYSAIFAVVILHVMCLGLLREVLSSFDCLLILCCRFAAALLELYEIFHVANSVGLLDGWVILTELIYALFIILPGNAILGCIDTIVLPRKVKLLVVLGCAMYYWWLWGQSSLLRDWSSTEICIGSHCDHVKEMYEALTWNCGLFVTKFAGSFIRGRDFAVLRSSYATPRYLQEENKALDPAAFVHMVSDFSRSNSMVHKIGRSRSEESPPGAPRSSVCPAISQSCGEAEPRVAASQSDSIIEISYPLRAANYQSSVEVPGQSLHVDSLKGRHVAEMRSNRRCLSSESTDHPGSEIGSKPSNHLLGRLNTAEYSLISSKLTDVSLEHLDGHELEREVCVAESDSQHEDGSNGSKEQMAVAVGQTLTLSKA